MLSGSPQPQISLVHHLHPLLKIAAASSLTVASLFLANPVSLGLILLFFLVVLLFSKVRPSLGAVLGLMFLLALVALGNYWASADPAEAAKYSLRFAVFALGVPVCAATTAPQELARALAQWRLPGPLVISLILVWRFFPVMRDELHEIRQANLLRGTGNVGRAQKWYRGVLLPLAFILMEYADQVSLALELRAFDPVTPRTYYRLPQVTQLDWWFLGSVILILLLAVTGDFFRLSP